MNWVKIEWRHTSENQPFLIYMELTARGLNKRKVELYKSGVIGFADEYHSVNGSILNEGVFPPVDEYNRLNKEAEQVYGSKDYLKAFEVKKEEFERIWKEKVG